MIKCWMGGLVIGGLMLSACQSSNSTADRASAPSSPTPDSPFVAPPPTPTGIPTPQVTVTAAPLPQPPSPEGLPPETSSPPAHPPLVNEHSPAPTGDLSPLESTYRQPDGLFELSFPHGYRYLPMEDGVSFISGDRQFGGSASVRPAQGQTLTAELLEQGLKAEYESRLQAVEWQATTVQPDGSLRVDWVGVDANGDVLDAVSFVEQHGDVIYILNLHAINEAYANYEAAATTIVEHYRLRGTPD
jgi:hypothetical protein